MTDSSLRTMLKFLMRKPTEVFIIIRFYDSHQGVTPGVKASYFLVAFFGAAFFAAAFFFAATLLSPPFRRNVTGRTIYFFLAAFFAVFLAAILITSPKG